MIIVSQDKEMIVNFERCSSIIVGMKDVVAILERSRMGYSNIYNRRKS